MEYLQESSIGAHQAQILMKPPSTCAEAHKHACQRCWGKQLSNEVEVVKETRLRCMFCLTEMGREDLVRLACKGTVKR